MGPLPEGTYMFVCLNKYLLCKVFCIFPVRNHSQAEIEYASAVRFNKQTKCPLISRF